MMLIDIKVPTTVDMSMTISYSVEHERHVITSMQDGDQDFSFIIQHKGRRQHWGYIIALYLYICTNKQITALDMGKVEGY